MKIKVFLDRMINWGNSIPASPWQLAALFAFTVILRNLMEALQLGIVFTSPSFFLHFPVAYVFPLLTLVFFMRIFSGYNTGKLLKIMVLAWTLTLLPPLIDSLTGTSSDIGYFPLERSNASWFLLNFFNPSVILTGTTTGIRIEAALGCILAGIFTWAVAPRRRILRGLLNTVVFAPVFLSFFTWPYLVALLLQPLFPGDGQTLTLLQWHAATEPPLSGASHFNIYIVDMIPVSLLSLWYVKELCNPMWLRFRKSIRNLIPLILAAVTGTVAAMAIPGSTGLTFSDSVVITGALLSALWLIAGSQGKNSFRITATAVALSLAWASGWLTLVFAVLALAVSALPFPERMRNSLFAVSLFITAISPVGFTLLAPSAIIALVLIPITVLLANRKPAMAAMFVLPMAFIIASPPASETGGWLRGANRVADTFTRSSRLGLAMESASRQAAAGGSWQKLAETCHMNGDNARSRYLCETSVSRGNASASMLRVSMNLAFDRGDSLEFSNIYLQYVNSIEENSDLNEALAMRVSFLALSGDTASLNSLHSRAGFNPLLLKSMGTALLAAGDTLSSLQYSLAYLQSPSAQAADWSRAIILSAITGEADWDSIYTEGESRFGICVPIMLARIRAPIVQGSPPDRADLLERCLRTMPGDKEVLETASMWYSASGLPDSALIYASRSLAGARYPSRALFLMVIRAALDSGNIPEAKAAAEYAIAEYPENIRFSAILAGIESGNDPDAEVPVFTEIPWAQALYDSISTMTCKVDSL